MPTKKQAKCMILLVPEVGLEPTHHRWRGILSQVRLPFRQGGHETSLAQVRADLKRYRRHIFNFVAATPATA